MTDSEKLGIAKAKFIAKIELIPTWDNFKNLVRNITPLQIKTFIKKALQDEANERRGVFAVKEVEKADSLETLKQEVDTI